jgi:hypothetical protein
MISSDEALAIFQRWQSASDDIKLTSTTPSTARFGGITTIGRLTSVTPTELLFATRKNRFTLSLEGATFRLVPREELIKTPDPWRSGEAVEVQRGDDLLLFLRPARTAG